MAFAKDASEKDLVKYIKDLNTKGYQYFEIRVNPFEVKNLKMSFAAMGVSIQEVKIKEYITFIGVSWNKNNLKLK